MSQWHTTKFLMIDARPACYSTAIYAAAPPMEPTFRTLTARDQVV